MNAIKSEELQGKKDNYISKNNTFRELWKALKYRGHEREMV